MKLINLRAQITNPFAPDYFKNLGCIFGSINSNWGWELEHTFYWPALFDIEFIISYQEDHYGIEFTVGLLGYGIHFRIYNRNHYDLLA